MAEQAKSLGEWAHGAVATGVVCAGCRQPVREFDVLARSDPGGRAVLGYGRPMQIYFKCTRIGCPGVQTTIDGRRI
jgi:hypothetical protein